METHWRHEHQLSGEYIMQYSEVKIIHSLKRTQRALLSSWNWMRGPTLLCFFSSRRLRWWIQLTKASFPEIECECSGSEGTEAQEVFVELSILSVAVFPLSSGSHFSENPSFSTLGSTRKILSGMKPMLFLIQNQIKCSPEGDSIK